MTDRAALLAHIPQALPDLSDEDLQQVAAFIKALKTSKTTQDDPETEFENRAHRLGSEGDHKNFGVLLEEVRAKFPHLEGKVLNDAFDGAQGSDNHIMMKLLVEEYEYADKEGFIDAVQDGNLELVRILGVNTEKGEIEEALEELNAKEEEEDGDDEMRGCLESLRETN